MHIYAIVNNEFTYPKLMNQKDRDFQKVLQALTSFDKKSSKYINKQIFINLKLVRFGQLKSQMPGWLFNDFRVRWKLNTRYFFF